jgi:Tfp pilus assembly protein PilF
VDPAAREKADQHCQRGRQLKAQGKFAEAAKELQKAIRSDPRHVEAHWVFAWVLIELKDTESARTELRKVIELAPESDKAREAQKALERIAP